MTKSLTIQTTSDTFTVIVADDHGLLNALSTQNPAHPLVLVEDNSVMYLNTRQVVAFTEDTYEGGYGTPRADDETEETPPTEEAPTEDTRTVAELKVALDAAGVEYDSKAVKADLLALAAEKNL